MTSAELIKELQKIDPDGTTEVMGSGGPIYFVDWKPGYYDGATQRLIQDPAQSPYFNVIGFEFNKNISKIVLIEYGFDDYVLDAFWEDKPLNIVYADDDKWNYRREYHQKTIDEMKEMARRHKHPTKLESIWDKIRRWKNIWKYRLKHEISKRWNIHK